jgi:hypothetical protein
MEYSLFSMSIPKNRFENGIIIPIIIIVYNNLLYKKTKSKTVEYLDGIIMSQILIILMIIE